jgi:hypothetical protein
MDNVRIFRENPIAWWDKPVMRYLRKKYGQNKREFVFIRSVYLALCEMESDFTDTPITFFTKTVGTYAGVSREVAGRCINVLIKEGLITKTRIVDEKTKKYLTGTIIQIKSLKADVSIPEPVSAFASNGSPQRWGDRAVLKKISNTKKVSINNNVAKAKWGNLNFKDKEEVNYYAELLAEKLGDKKSFSFYKAICARNDPQRLLQKAQEIIRDGGARNPAAVFVDWLKSYSEQQRLLN